MQDPERIKRLLSEYPLMFSRLIAMGFPVWELLKKKALIVGAGGLGVIVAEILARTGIGGMVIVDRDTVSPENFNRLGFIVEDVGRPKAEALAEKLRRVRNVPGIPEKFQLEVKSYYADIVGWDELDEVIEGVDIIFVAVDNDIARREINVVGVEHGKPIVSGATSADGYSGTVMTTIPGKTPCYECYFRRSTVRISTLPRIGQCDASIATTMAVVASVQAQQGINILLGTGKVYPLIKIYLAPELEIVRVEGLRPNPRCPVCGRWLKSAGARRNNSQA